MSDLEHSPRSLTVPAGAFAQLRRAIGGEAGPQVATHALHGAGFAAGEAFFREFVEELGVSDPSEVPASRFWKELDQFFEVRGWGRITQERIHPGFGLLHAADWGESDPTAGERQPGCAFSAGVFAQILGAVAPGPIAVLEVGCRSRGDDECTFLVGGEDAIHSVYGFLVEGDTLDEALDHL